MVRSKNEVRKKREEEQQKGQVHDHDETLGLDSHGALSESISSMTLSACNQSPACPAIAAPNEDPAPVVEEGVEFDPEKGGVLREVDDAGVPSEEEVRVASGRVERELMMRPQLLLGEGGDKEVSEGLGRKKKREGEDAILTQGRLESEGIKGKETSAQFPVGTARKGRSTKEPYLFDSLDQKERPRGSG